MEEVFPNSRESARGTPTVPSEMHLSRAMLKVHVLHTIARTAYVVSIIEFALLPPWRRTNHENSENNKQHIIENFGSANWSRFLV